MPELEKKTIETADGEKIEVYDASQVEEAIKEKDDGLKEATDAKTELEGNLKEVTEKLEKMDESDKDFKELRSQKEKLEDNLKEKDTTIESLTKEKEDAEGKLTQTEQKYRKDTYIKSLAGDDADLKKKIEFHLESTVSAMPESTPEELQAKLKAAYTQSTGVTDADQLNNIISSAGGGESGASQGKVSDELKQFGKNFGLTDEDWDNAADAGVIK